MRHREPQVIKVRCSRAVAVEMCRYDCATIVGEELVDDKFDAVVDKWACKSGWSDDEVREEKERHRVYEFTISSHYQITIGRWHSFGVGVEVVK